jgi:hypothetical protein
MPAGSGAWDLLSDADFLLGRGRESGLLDFSSEIIWNCHQENRKIFLHAEKALNNLLWKSRAKGFQTFVGADSSCFALLCTT